jgi:flagellar biosynthesis anti-sigma factor FlgM
MRIDLNTVLQGSATQKSEKSNQLDGKAKPSINPDGGPEDTVSLSSLVEQVMKAPETRQDKIDSLRQAVQNGQYSLDPHQIAEAILKNSSK